MYWILYRPISAVQLGEMHMCVDICVVSLSDDKDSEGKSKSKTKKEPASMFQINGDSKTDSKTKKKGWSSRSRDLTNI